MKRIVGMMRIKNEARWIHDVIKSMLPVCEHVFIFDDHSTDDTRAICRAFGDAVTVYESPFEGLDETRDKNWLIERVEQSNPDWVIHIDGDEELGPGSAAAIRGAVEEPGHFRCFAFRILYLWNDRKHIRMDGIYGTFKRPSLFRMVGGERFRSVAGGGFHCGNVPVVDAIGHCGAAVLHYGYMEKEDRLRKFAWYTAPDKQPIPAWEDGYRHMVIGDILPADVTTMHAGPLHLVEIG